MKLLEAVSIRRNLVSILSVALLASASCISVVASAQASATSAARSFTIAMIPDTQAYVDFRYQTENGFKFNARDLMTQQMQYIADHAVSAGGDIAFLTHVGDVWQHQTIEMDPAHIAKGFKAIPNPWVKGELELSQKAITVEMPAAKAAFSLIDGKLPFGVAPGNHDYDAMWSDSRWPPTTDVNKLRSSKGVLTADLIGMLHMGGLTNFKQVFADTTSFFKDKPWYIASYNDGASSAQKFTAGGYTFLNIALEMSPEDDTFAWVRSVLAANPGLPTIVSTHGYMATDTSRSPLAIGDPKAVDPDNNNPQDIWDELITKNDQIFMVLCGHISGQAYREDLNDFGHKVYQILADYQSRGQSTIDAGVPLAVMASGKYPSPTGDGWLRLMQFAMDGNIPSIHVRTYSTFYKGYSTDLPNYAAWYKGQEAPALTDAQYLAKDDFIVPLVDFRSRFGQ